MRHHKFVSDDGLNHVLYPLVGACAAVYHYSLHCDLTSLVPTRSAKSHDLSPGLSSSTSFRFTPSNLVSPVILFIKLAAFAKSEKRHFSFATFIRSHGTSGLPLDGVIEICYLSFFENLASKLKVSLKSGYFT